MARITDTYAGEKDRTLFICDFSPPRGSDPQSLEPARHLNVNFISIAYNPGKAVRVSSVLAAQWIKANAGKDVVFTLATRDMNKLAIESLLLGADLLGLENVVVVRGDELNQRDLSHMKAVNDFTPTELIRSIGQMNEGLDFKELKLRSATNLCVGATIDLGRNLEREIELTRRKVEAGAQFFINQPTFHPDAPRQFLSMYAEKHGEELAPPVFHGVQVMAKDGVIFSSVPKWVTDDLEKGRSGEDIALQVLNQFSDAGFRSIYLVPPIMRGGRRDYESAQAVLDAFQK